MEVEGSLSGRVTGERLVCWTVTVHSGELIVADACSLMISQQRADPLTSLRVVPSQSLSSRRARGG